MAVEMDNLLQLVDHGVSNAEDCRRIWYADSPDFWTAVTQRYLYDALCQAATTAYFGGQPLPASREQALAAVDNYPVLKKTDYWHSAEKLRLPGYETLTAHRFHTSGTELGVPTEQPWDEWTFRRSFSESSAIALTRCGVQAGDGVIIGSPGFGALAMSYRWAAELLGLRYQADEYAFSDDDTFKATLDFAQQDAVNTLVATPGALVTFIDQCRRHQVEPKSLGIRRIISGVGNFLTERHLDLAIREFAPDTIMEQGGKNEILHAPGAVRYDLQAPGAVCEEGYLHYLPYVSFVQAVDPARLNAVPRAPLADGENGVLLMSRLTVGRPGVVAYLNDAGDLGATRTFTAGAPCNCGSRLPAFRFLGRAGGSLSNRLGDTLFTEEFGLALNVACRAAGLALDEATKIRLQMVLVRDQDENEADALCWILGVCPQLHRSRCAAIQALLNGFIRHWVGYSVYSSGRFSKYMTIGSGCLVDIAAMPHAGRDKPQYKLAECVIRNTDENVHQTLARHIRNTLKTVALSN